MPSTVINSYTYDADKKILQIKFVSGLVYNYIDIPEHVYLAMKDSRAKGIFFNQHIKDKYQFEKQTN
jgi:hypothetical protein